MNKRKVPKIRFKGFHDDWEQRKFSDVVDIGSGMDYKHLGEGDIPVYGTGGYMLSVDSALSEKKDAIGIGRKGTIDKPYILKAPFWTVDTLFYCIPKENHDLDFTNCLFQNVDWKKKDESTGVPSLSKVIINNVEAVVPSFDEQKKIGEYFNSLDNLITLHQKKCFEWKKSGFSCASISWEQRKVQDVADRFDNLRIPVAASLRVHGTTPYYGANGIQDYVEGFTHDGEFVLVAEDGANDLKNYPVKCVNGRIWVNNHAHVLQRKAGIADNSFLAFAISQSDMESLLVGGGRAKLNAETLMSIEFRLPCLQEQYRIGEYLTQLDHLITLHQRKLELLKRLKNSLINRCFTGEKYTMSKKILYHGSPNRVIVPKFGFGEDRHDYGRGFYLTENLELAKEWAVCRPDETNGWVHKYELEMDGLNILDFQKYYVLSWLAELMKHRDAADSRRYKMLAQKFIEKYGIDTCGYDVITGWRANASYFYIAKEFVRDNIDIEILEELLSLGGLGIQFCIKSERAFAQLSEVEQDIMSVDYSEFNDRYNERDINARNKMRALVDSDANKVTQVFSTLFER